MKIALLGAVGRLMAGPCVVDPPPVFETADRTPHFAGRTLELRESEVPTGAGPSTWSAAPQAVSVDEQGLHLRLTEAAQGDLYGAEVRTRLRERPRTVSFTLSMPAGLPHEDMVGAVFLYTSDRCELDLELGRWGDPEAAEAQVAAGDPRGGPAQVVRFALDPTVPARHTLELRGRRATWTTEVDGEVVARSRLSRLPRFTPAYLHVNLWARPGTRLNGEEAAELLLHDLVID